LGSFGFVSKLTSALVPSGWLAQLGSFGISRLSGKGMGSFWFVFKATSALVPSAWLAPLGSFGISRLCGKGLKKTRARLRNWECVVRGTLTCLKSSRRLEQAISGK
jgi:hypothetical protein